MPTSEGGGASLAEKERAGHGARVPERSRGMDSVVLLFHALIYGSIHTVMCAVFIARSFYHIVGNFCWCKVLQSCLLGFQKKFLWCLISRWHSGETTPTNSP